MFDKFINSHLNLKHRQETRAFLNVAVPLFYIIVIGVAVFALLYWYHNFYL